MAVWHASTDEICIRVVADVPWYHMVQVGQAALDKHHRVSLQAPPFRDGGGYVEPKGDKCTPNLILGHIGIDFANE